MKLISLATTATVALFGIGGGSASRLGHLRRQRGVRGRGNWVRSRIEPTRYHGKARTICKLISYLLVSASLFLAAPVHAGLIARDIGGNSVTDAYYDTDLNITWLRDANINGPMNWSVASAWANNLTIGNYSGWRLPKGDECHIGPCTSSTNEMSHLYYSELGNPEGGPMSNKGGFVNVQLDPYWTNKIISTGWASEVSFLNGDTGHLPTSFLRYAMAVRDGDVVTTCTSPQVLQNGACVTQPAPSVLTLAKLSADVYGDPNKGDVGFDRYKPHGITGFVSAPVTNAISNAGSTPQTTPSAPPVLKQYPPGIFEGADGFKANVYKDSDSNQIVISVRGTNFGGDGSLKNLLADTSFSPKGRANALLISYVSQLADLLKIVHNSNSNLSITLTGHSMGGAVAQIVGKNAGIEVTSFDAPGANGVLDEINRKVGQLAVLPRLNILTPSTNVTHFRMAGDMVSLVGMDETSGADGQVAGTVTVTVANPRSVSTSPGGYGIPVAVATWNDLINNHDMPTLADQIQALCPTGVGLGCTNGYKPQFNTIGKIIKTVRKACTTKLETAGNSYLGIIGDIFGAEPATLPNFCEDIAIPVVAQIFKWIDPAPGNHYFLQSEIGSPFIDGISLPTLTNVFGWALRYHDQFGWSGNTTIIGESDFIFSTEVDALLFTPLDIMGNQTFNTDYFAYGLKFSSDGNFGATQATFVTVPEPAGLLLFAASGVALVFVQRRKRDGNYLR